MGKKSEETNVNRENTGQTKGKSEIRISTGNSPSKLGINIFSGFCVLLQTTRFKQELCCSCNPHHIYRTQNLGIIKQHNLCYNLTVSQIFIFSTYKTHLYHFGFFLNVHALLLLQDVTKAFPSKPELLPWKLV